jgi:hypothetical protein
MASGYKSNQVDLDQIFQPRGGATPVANTGYLVAGVDLAQRYAPRVTPPVPVTGFKSSGVDLNQIFNGIPAVGFSYRFVNPGTSAPFKQASTLFSGGSAVSYPTGKIVIAFSTNGIELLTGSFAYPGGLRVSNITNDFTGITYISNITIPSTTENAIDTLWSDLPGSAIPGIGVGMATGSFQVYQDSSSSFIGETLLSTNASSNTSMAAFIAFVVAQPIIYVLSYSSTNTSLGAVPVTTGDTEGLWSAITAQAQLAGLYSGTNKVMLAPVSNGINPYALPGGTNFNTPYSFYATLGTTSTNSPQSILYTSPSMLIERF